MQNAKFCVASGDLAVSKQIRLTKCMQLLMPLNDDYNDPCHMISSMWTTDTS